MKKYLFLMQRLLLVLVGFVSASHVGAYDFKVANGDGVTIYYNINGNDVTVTSGDQKYEGDVRIPATVMNDGISYDVTAIGADAFNYCGNLTAIEIPSTVTSIGSQAFYFCGKLAVLTIPGSVKSIGNYAFAGCGITTLELSEGIETIGASAFHNCSKLTSITIPSTVESIGKSAFSRTDALCSISVAADNTIYDSRNGCNAIIEKASNTLVTGCQTTVIPEGVTAIGADAFNYCGNLTAIEIPSTVTSIGSQAFYFCGKLTKVVSKIREPFKINISVFQSIPGNAVLYIPVDTKEAYENVGGWNFSKIIEITEEITPYAIWCEGNTTLYFLSSIEYKSAGNIYDGQTITHVWSGTDVTETGETIPKWREVVADKVTKVVFDESFKEVLPNGTYWWFYNNKKLESIEGIENLNTSEVTNMRAMFSQCEKLKDIDVSKFNTEKVKTMRNLFAGCRMLKTLDLSNFNTSNVENMFGMFQYCDSLKNIDIHSFNTTNVKSMHRMFFNCRSLNKLDLTSFNTTNVETMDSMFFDCRKIGGISVGDGWTTDNVQSSKLMFANCIKLRGENGTRYDKNYVDGSYAHIDQQGNPGYFSKDLIVNLILVCSEGGYLKYNGEKVTNDSVSFEVEIGDTVVVNCEEMSCFKWVDEPSSLSIWIGAEIIVYNNHRWEIYDINQDVTISASFNRIIEDIPFATNEMRTFCSPYPLDFTGIEGLYAYIASGFSAETGEVLMSRVEKVPAKTGLFLIGEPDKSYRVPAYETDFFYSNLLEGVTKATSITSGYVLDGDQFVSFLGSYTVNDGEAYLKIPYVGGKQQLGIRFTDTTTGMEDLKMQPGDEAAWYTLQGTRLTQKPTQQGIYLHQGKKVLVK